MAKLTRERLSKIGTVLLNLWMLKVGHFPQRTLHNVLVPSRNMGIGKQAVYRAMYEGPQSLTSLKKI